MTNQDEWTTVSDGNAEQEPEVKIVFEEHGDEYIGIFLGYREIRDRETQQYYTQARFQDPDETGAICYTRANHSMKEGLDRVPIGSLTRVVYATDTDTGMPSPMRTFTVQTKGRAAITQPAAGQGNSASRPVRRAQSRTVKPGKPQGEKA